MPIISNGKVLTIKVINEAKFTIIICPEFCNADAIGPKIPSCVIFCVAVKSILTASNSLSYANALRSPFMLSNCDCL